MIPSVIRREEYLAHALNFTGHEIDLCKDLMEWLPDSIIDCHVHSNLADHVECMEKKVIQTIISTFPRFSIDESRLLDEVLYPEKNMRKLRFAQVFRGLDHKKANEYLLDNSPMNDRVAIFGLPDDVEYTVAIMQHPRVSALKMYYLYVNPTATRIYQYFTPEILEVAQDLGLPIILHLPKMLTSCLDDLLNLLTNFPRLPVVLAHLGLSKIPVPGLIEAYEKVAAFDQIFLDTAMNSSVDVIHMALRTFGENRVIYGSDEPFNLLRYVAYMNQEYGQQRVVTEYKYHWLNADDHKKYRHLAHGVPHVHWQSLMAIKNAIQLLPKKGRTKAKERIFYDNARVVFGF